MSLTVYFLRHGETPTSHGGVFTGSMDVELTPQGYQMALDFTAAYKSLSWVAVYCSPLRRAMATAQPLCEAVGLEMQVRDGLKEYSFGEWGGSTPEEVNSRFRDDYLAWLADAGWNRPTGGERGIDVARRSSPVMAEIEAAHPEGDVLVVSHKATIRIILCSLLGIDIGQYRDRLSQPVASLSVVEFTAQGPQLKSFGDRAHVRPELRDRPGT